MAALSALILVLTACGDGDPARAAVTAFASALADSSYLEAWEMITPGSRMWYDSTVTILHTFGWTESAAAAGELAGEMTEEEFLALTGQELFSRMVERSPEVHNLSRNVRSVSYRTDSLAVVVLRTDEGLQEVVVRCTDGVWLVDLTELGPPMEGE